MIERDQHIISRKLIAPNALMVLYRLGEAGFHAFIVGGGVRDLLLGNRPKDFDIATNASPEKIKRLFRNARIIGRRFKIVHIRFGREIIEVTTFRAHHDPQHEIDDDVPRRRIRGLDSAHSSAGMILRDNVYGDINEDAMRRDFTINALYYTIDGFRVLDFCNGMEDLKARQIRIIGDPVARYKEDPVRLLRAVRFAAKLGFTIEQDTRLPMEDYAYLLSSISPARLFDETLKLMTGGHAVTTFRLLREFKLGEYLFNPTLGSPATGACGDGQAGGSGAGEHRLAPCPRQIRYPGVSIRRPAVAGVTATPGRGGTDQAGSTAALSTGHYRYHYGATEIHGDSEKIHPGESGNMGAATAVTETQSAQYRKRLQSSPFSRRL